jgi:hypothetical protein
MAAIGEVKGFGDTLESAVDVVDVPLSLRDMSPYWRKDRREILAVVERITTGKH